MDTAFEDDDRRASDVPSSSAAPEEYEGDVGESYRDEDDEDDEEDDDDAFDEAFDVEMDGEDSYYDDEDGAFDDEGDGDLVEVDGTSDHVERQTTTATGTTTAPARRVAPAISTGGTSSRTSSSASGMLPHDAAHGNNKSHSNNHVPLSALMNNSFAPPFYGRPPTPLPPSPSLTSLLRPSRPTTPDATDDELEPVPRAAPRVPTYEYYGFVLHLFSSLAFLMYLLWSYLPSPFLHALGIYYYPNRWWSLALPSFLVMTLVYIYVALATYNTEILTLPLDHPETIVDEAAKIAAIDVRGRVVVVGGPDGRHVQGRGATASASEHSARHRHLHRHRDQHQHDHVAPAGKIVDTGASAVLSLAAGTTNTALATRRLAAAAPAGNINVTVSSPWSADAAGHMPFGHQRAPSSPSPPLDKTVWRDRAIAGKSGRDRKNRRGTGAATEPLTEVKSHSVAGTSVADEGDFTMGGRCRSWITSSSRGDRYGLADTTAQRTLHLAGSAADWKQLWNEGTDAVMDIPLAGVCEVLYA